VFIRTLASAPGVVKVFLDRSPGLAPFAGNLIASVNTMARDSVVQVRKGIESADPAVAAEADAQAALRAAREAEQALRA
jgi:GTP cyclohydrolase III